MTRSATASRAPDGAWGVENMRCTLFHLLAKPAVEGLWGRIVGTEPESVTSRPKAGEHIEAGDWTFGRLTMLSQQKRIEWRVNFADEYNPSPALFPDVCSALLNLVNDWFRTASPSSVTRLAFGAVVLLPVGDGEAGYRTLSDYLPFDIDRTSSRDFLYQINRQRPCAAVPEATVNRLTRWSVSKSTRMLISPSGEGIIASEDPADSTHNCRLELDINTAPVHGFELPTNRLEQLFNELVVLGRELIREGDIP